MGSRSTIAAAAKIACYAFLAAAATLLVARWMAAVHAAGAIQRPQRAAAHRDACEALDATPDDRPAPAFTLAGLEGQQLALSSLKGQTVLLHFWFTRCPPCVAELPSLVALRSALRGQPFSLLTIAVDEEPSEVKRFLAKHGLAQLPVLLDPERRVPTSYGTEKYPESYLIDRTGQVRLRFINKRDWSSATARACIGSFLRAR